ncbi:MAG: hypothetical protein LR001_03735 [Clostridiales bacterium]|nr:hypothetical protein [Clostridiales bacterium]
MNISKIIKEYFFRERLFVFKIMLGPLVVAILPVVYQILIRDVIDKLYYDLIGVEQIIMILALLCFYLLHLYFWNYLYRKMEHGTITSVFNKLIDTLIKSKQQALSNVTEGKIRRVNEFVYEIVYFVKESIQLPVKFVAVIFLVLYIVFRVNATIVLYLLTLTPLFLIIVVIAKQIEKKKKQIIEREKESNGYSSDVTTTKKCKIMLSELF